MIFWYLYLHLMLSYSKEGFNKLGLGCYSKWTEHHILLLCCLGTGDWREKGWRTAVLQSILCCGYFGLFYIGMKCQECGILCKGKFSILAHLSDGYPEHQMPGYAESWRESSSCSTSTVSSRRTDQQQIKLPTKG